MQLANDDAGVIVTADIDSGRQLFNNEQCKVTSPVLMGDTSLDFVPIASFQGEKVPIKPNDVLQGQMAANVTGSIVDIQQQAAQTLNTLSTAAQHIDTLTKRVDRLMETNEQRITDMIGEANKTLPLLQQTLEAMTKTLEASNDLLGDSHLRARSSRRSAKCPSSSKRCAAPWQASRTPSPR